MLNSGFNSVNCYFSRVNPSSDNPIDKECSIKAAIYCRVSTDNQEREGTSLETQFEACLKYCQEKQYEVSNRFCEAYSGLTLERPKHDYFLRNHVFCAICGKPLVGHCLSKKYRYYQCSNARPYEYSDKKCNALYIRADNLEQIVWNRTMEVLKDPTSMLASLTAESNPAKLDAINTDIAELRKQLLNYEKRRHNLLDSMELGEFDKDEILDRLNNLKRLRIADEARLNDLQKTQENITSLANAKMKLGHLHERVLENLENATLENKALALDALGIKVYAKGVDDIQIHGIIPLALPTIARTSA